jgi:hypothetical protein
MSACIFLSQTTFHVVCGEGGVHVSKWGGGAQGGALGLEVGTHVRQQNRVKGGCFLLGACCSKMAKRG